MKNSLVLQRNRLFLGFIFLLTLNAACHSDHQVIPVHTEKKEASKIEQSSPMLADAATILQRKQVPILCYHQIRDWRPTDSKQAKDYIVPLNNFREQIKALADSGYHTILPDQLYDYLLKGASLPSKPVMLTFDDNKEDHYTIARDEMMKYGFKGVFFIMTVSLGRPGYMSKEQIKQLFDEGNVIGSHTWDHGNVKTYQEKDWERQLDKPAKQLEQIIGKHPEYFAYPFGLWDTQAIDKLRQRDYKAVFQLSAKRDEQYPLYTIRRMIVPGEWNANTMMKWMRSNF